MTSDAISIKRNLATAVLLALGALYGTLAKGQSLDGCPSKDILAKFEEFGRSGKMPPDLGQWLFDPNAQYVTPYRAFDNVYYVGICWVSSWLIKTNDGLILIDTLHEPFSDRLLENIKQAGFDVKDIKFVLMTHGHFDHVGGADKLKQLTHAQFIMTQAGWDEAVKSSRESERTPRAWRMIAPDRVAKDGDVISLGDQRIRVYETPGHTYGTASYSFDVKDGPKTYRAFTVGGLGLNAIEGSKQVESFISSIRRIEQLIASPNDPIQVHLTTHPFSNGLTEAKELLKGRKAGDPHPLVDPEGFRKQLEQLRAGAEDRLLTERKAGR
jgi:metallo-beta-lactamase class B